MARTPNLTDAEFDELVAVVEAAGYDSSKLQRIPHRWPEAVTGQ
jgi:lipocalin